MNKLDVTFKNDIGTEIILKLSASEAERLQKALALIQKGKDNE